MDIDKRKWCEQRDIYPRNRPKAENTSRGRLPNLEAEKNRYCLTIEQFWRPETKKDTGFVESDFKQNVDITKSHIDEKRKRLQRDGICPYGPKEEQIYTLLCKIWRQRKRETCCLFIQLEGKDPDLTGRY